MSGAAARPATARRSTLPRRVQNYLRNDESPAAAIIDNHGGSTFAWSKDGKSFAPIGDPFKFGWGNYRGTRDGIYFRDDEAELGIVDVDYFHYSYSGS